MAAMQPSRLSGARAFMNKMIRERWDIGIDRFDIDETGAGTALYHIRAPGQEFSFIAFSRPPSSKMRTGRIIGRAWDMMGTLNEGPANDADIEAARAELPKLYRGRSTKNTLVWCRSNRSMRVFDHTVEALMRGDQPDVSEIAGACYLMRNTGLDGNGTFGTRSFPSLGPDHALGGPLEAQLLNAYLMREFSCDLVEHLARLKSDKAVSLKPELRRFIGVGNGSALGLIFFIHRHPRLINSWIKARETAIAEARGLELKKGDPRFDRLVMLLEKAIVFRRQDRMTYETLASSTEIAADLDKIVAAVRDLQQSGAIAGDASPLPLDQLIRHFENELHPESVETLLSLMIELVPETADRLAAKQGGVDELPLQASRTVADLRAIIASEYQWALNIDMSAPDASTYVWYKSETAEEPRRGPRSEVPHALDLGLDLPGGVQKLKADLEAFEGDAFLSRFLMAHPEHRYLVGRLQSLSGEPYHSPIANINAGDFIPIDLVRLMNVTVHGIDKTRDFLNRNLRGVLFHGAPTTDEIRAGKGEFWYYPEEPVL
ncbi:hypothetical protein K1W69_10575 [Hoeflea sp. WL0058]|uniref:Uncharacterized protein n=1 Tax=Flavimaribacter sediminis TaxID=2865987 RepID=A0AAE2ZN64_9HYPH|nr:hypothetical protein [Flavimaribacter sediminis]